MNNLYYQDSISGGHEVPEDDTVLDWMHFSKKENWRIVRLPNGYYQTEVSVRNSEQTNWNDVTRRDSIEAAECAIDSSCKHFAGKLHSDSKPDVVKTF